MAMWLVLSGSSLLVEHRIRKRHCTVQEEARVFLDQTQRDGVTLIELRGRADIYSSNALRQSLLEIIDSGKIDLIIDLDGLAHIDSSGLAALVWVFEKTSLSGGSLKFVCSKAPVLNALTASGFNRAIPIHNRVEEYFN